MPLEISDLKELESFRHTFWLPKSVCIIPNPRDSFVLKRTSSSPSARSTHRIEDVSFPDNAPEFRWLEKQSHAVDPFVLNPYNLVHWPNSYLVPRRYAHETPTTKSLYFYNPRLPDYGEFIMIALLPNRGIFLVMKYNRIIV